MEDYVSSSIYRRVNQKGEKESWQKLLWLIKSYQNELSDYAVLNRFEFLKDVAFLIEPYLKKRAAITGTRCPINNPFWWSADWLNFQ